MSPMPVLRCDCPPAPRTVTRPMASQDLPRMHGQRRAGEGVRRHPHDPRRDRIRGEAEIRRCDVAAVVVAQFAGVVALGVDQRIASGRRQRAAQVTFRAGRIEGTAAFGRMSAVRGDERGKHQGNASLFHRLFPAAAHGWPLFVFGRCVRRRGPANPNGWGAARQQGAAPYCGSHVFACRAVRSAVHLGEIFTASGSVPAGHGRHVNFFLRGRVVCFDPIPSMHDRHASPHTTGKSDESIIAAAMQGCLRPGNGRT